MELNDLLVQVGNLAEKFGIYKIINASPGTYKIALVEIFKILLHF